MLTKWTPPACGHPLSEGDDLTPALSWRRGRRTDARDGTYRTNMTDKTNRIMKTTRIYALLALLMMGGVRLQAQVNEPVEIFESPMIIAYHFCQWNEGEVLLNANVLGDGRYIIRMDEDGNDLEMDRWHLNDNTCSFLTESKFFRNSDGKPCFYYV